MPSLSKRIKAAQAKAKSEAAWSKIKTRPTRTVISNLRADIRK